MWTTLALVAGLGVAPAQAGELALTNPRITYGVLGGTRPDTKFLPGDLFFLSFDIENLKLDRAGNASYTMAMEVYDKKDGKRIFKQDAAKPQVVSVPLGGTRLPANAHLILGGDEQPGTYVCELTVTDSATKVAKKVSQEFELLKRDFGIVGFLPTLDPNAAVPAPMQGVVGQTVYLHFLVTAFDRDPKTGQPNLEAKLVIRDGQGEPATPEPQTHRLNKGVDSKESAVPVLFTVPLTRAGKFVLEMEAADAVNGKKAKLSMPLTVVDPAAK